VWNPITSGWPAGPAFVRWHRRLCGNRATRLGVTPGAVSQQLAVLRRAGVVDAHRSGRGVYSELTPLGQSLIGLLDG